MQGHIEALTKIQEALADLEEDQAKQVIRWVADYYGVPVAGAKGAKGETIGANTLDGDSDTQEFEDIGDLLDAANPSTDAERALLVGYWLQIDEDQDGLSGQQINNELKNMGYGIKNITTAMTNLINRKPSLMRQVSKTGSSRQAKKTYKVTKAGISEVRRMIAGTSGGEE